MIEYKIFKEVYDDIISGKKTIEFRLLNDKSKKIKKNDLIKFNVVDSDNYIVVRVINKYIYNNLEDLWSHKEILANTLTYTKEQFFEAFDNIFGEKMASNSKIVGIEFDK